MHRQCIICECELNDPENYPTDGETIPIVYDATVWRTTGNFGSTVYDPIDSSEFIEAYICDKCFTNKKSLMYKIIMQDRKPLKAIYVEPCH